jgi:histone deacetylase 1/2
LNPHIVEELAITSISSHAADIASTGPVAFTTPEKPEGSDINNLVLAILELLRSYPHVLYIDIDCHYRGCVDEAFYTKDRVTTCCFHEFGECFLGIGTQEDKGPPSQGKGYAINVQLKDGSMDETYTSFFESVIPRTLFVCLYIYLSHARCQNPRRLQRSAAMLYFGADSLAEDKLGCFGMTTLGNALCDQFLGKQNISLIPLGGGSYTVKNVALPWTYKVACALWIENEIDPYLP